MTLRAIGYVRVSTEEQAREGVSLAAQDGKIRAYAMAKDLELVDVVRDEGLSGKTLERPGLQRVIAACQAHDVDAVVVVKLDRLSRRTRDLLELVEDVCDRNDVALHSLSEAVDTKSAAGRFFLRIMGALAEMERELIGERTAAALAHKVARGERLGASPYGFATPVPRQPLQPVPAEQRTIRQIVRLRRSGATFQAIADQLNRAGTPSKRGASWHPMTVARVVQHAAASHKRSYL